MLLTLSNVLRRKLPSFLDVNICLFCLSHILITFFYKLFTPNALCIFSWSYFNAFTIETIVCTVLLLVMEYFYSVVLVLWLQQRSWELLPPQKPKPLLIPDGKKVFRLSLEKDLGDAYHINWNILAKVLCREFILINFVTLISFPTRQIVPICVAKQVETDASN